jgi:prevent-host-death family protein
MREIKASEFKAKCLALIDEVAETGEAIVITKHGRPVVRVEPGRAKPKGPAFGCLKGMVDLVDPDDDLDVKSEADLKWWRDRMDRLAKSISRPVSKHPRKKGR